MLKALLNRSLNARQTSLIVLGIAGLFFVGYQGWLILQERILAARLQAALPSVLAQIRTQRGMILSALESYKARFGRYPADHMLTAKPPVIDPVTNALVYELSGVVYNPTSQTFNVTGLEGADARFVTNVLQSGWFHNCSETETGITRFISSSQFMPTQFHDDPDVYGLAVPLQFSEDTDPRVMYSMYRFISSWRYVSSAPTNNPGRFDLWIEIEMSGRKIIIGNWKGVE